jgi:hypothetical protein
VFNSTLRNPRHIKYLYIASVEWIRIYL